ncbi:protein pob, putative [Ixodes scapularis]|uniref:ER membrane protein complex subunit 3 n=1 Tax=Ixodes scapularis TaxID=6945 RepID=B7QCH8_IXOSC|nr:protein pob, putative [Ixodes scapularis]|eukprot:XP_002413242.1 protein pob, putative [Ixodes scapularis]
MAELLLDPDIRIWVFLPIVVITFLIGIVRHYVSILISSTKKVELQQVQDSTPHQKPMRLLSSPNAHSCSKSFLMRKNFFNHEETGYFKTPKRAPVMQNPMTDPSMMTDMLKGNLTNVLPMIVIGGWINWTFSGFVTSSCCLWFTDKHDNAGHNCNKASFFSLPFYVPRVSSASWYFLNVFGLRSIYALVLGENNAADQTRVMQDQMSGAALAMPPDPKQAFKVFSFKQYQQS